MIDNFDETNFSHKLLLTDRQDENFRKAFASKLTTDTVRS